MRRKGSHSCQFFCNMLKFQDVPESDITIKGIAMVKPTANKSSCNSYSQILSFSA